MEMELAKDILHRVIPARHSIKPPKATYLNTKGAWLSWYNRQIPNRSMGTIMGEVTRLSK